MSSYDAEEAEEWINKVNLVQQTIKDLSSNDPDALKQADYLINKLSRDKREKNAKKSAQCEKNKQFRKGDGWKNEYKFYCNNCFMEILINTKQCPQCNYSKLITRTERRNTLQERVDILKKEYDLKEKRRKRWESYRKLHYKNEYNLTDYSEWELWEDEIDWNDYMDDNYIPTHLRGMADDLKQRSEKRRNEMRAAVKEKTQGNKYLKLRNYAQAITHYSSAIQYRRDYKALYTNRALAYMKLGRYDKCVTDCSIVIDMISFVDPHEKKSDIIFKAYLRRANAYQLLGNLSKAKKDVSNAINLRPKQKDALSLNDTIDVLINDENMRQEIQKEILNDKKLTNFDNALKLTLDYFARNNNKNKNKESKNQFDDKTAFDKRISKWHSEKPMLLFSKLLDLIAQKQEYAVRFADNNGLFLGFKYLERELACLQNEMKELHCQEYGLQALQSELINKQMTLAKLCKLLIYIASYKPNKALISRDHKLINCIAYCIYYIILSFEQYQCDDLSIESIHLSSTCCEIKEIRDHIANNASYSKLFYKNINEYLLYSPPNNNKLQILQYLFDFLENLFGNSSFIKVSILLNNPNTISSNPHIYVALFNYLSKYSDYVHSARMGQEEMMKFEIKQSVVSSILTALATLFGPNELFIREILMKDTDINERMEILKTHLIHLNRMFMQFEEKNPLKNMNRHLNINKHQMNVNISVSKQQTQQVLSKLYEKHQLNIAQIAKVITVFMSLSHHPIVHPLLLQLEIHEILFDLVPYVRYIDYKNIQYAHILSLARDHIINYFDQISNNKKFDKIIEKYNKQCGTLSSLSIMSNNNQLLPPFWTFITDIINRRSFIKNNVNDLWFGQEKESKESKNSNNNNNHHSQHHKGTKRNNNRRGRHRNNHRNNHKKHKQQNKISKINQNNNALMIRRDKDHKTNFNVTYNNKHKNNNINDDNWDYMEVDAQSACIRIITRWIRRRLPDDKKRKNNNNENNNENNNNKSDDDGEDDDGKINIVADELKKNNNRNNGNYLNCGTSAENRIIDILLQKQYNNIFKYIKYCDDPHVLANAPLLLKQFIIYAKLNEKNKPYLKKIIKKHSKKKLKDLMALFTNEHVSIIQNSVTCMAQLATFDEDLRDKIREMGGLKAMSQLHMQHRQTLFK